MILRRIFINLKIFNHCLIILYFYKFKNFSDCIELIKYKRNMVKVKLNPIYVSKKINLFSYLLNQQNCFFRSMCLYTLLNFDEEVEFRIGIKKDDKNKFSSHSWIEFEGEPVNENKLVRDYKSIFSLKKNEWN